MVTLMKIISTVFGVITRIGDTPGESTWMIGNNEFVYLGKGNYFHEPCRWGCVTWMVDAPTLRECVGKALALDRSYHCSMWDAIMWDAEPFGLTKQQLEDNDYVQRA